MVNSDKSHQKRQVDPFFLTVVVSSIVRVVS